MNRSTTSSILLHRLQPFLEVDMTVDCGILAGDLHEEDAVAAAGIVVCLIALSGWLVGWFWFNLGFGLSWWRDIHRRKREHGRSTR